VIKLGLVDFDTSHAVSFTQKLNHVDAPDDQLVDGATVVAGWPGQSRHSPDRVRGYTQQLADYGITIVDEMTDLIGMVDGIIIHANDGSVHLQRAAPFIEARIPCYIDKPFTCSVADAVALADLAETHDVPIFSTSPQRYVPQVPDVLQDASVGRIIGAYTTSPAHEHKVNPGLFNYGVHGVELLYSFMGPGCERLSCAWEGEFEVVTGVWADGRVGVMRGVRRQPGGYWFTVWGDNGVRSEALDRTYNHRELIRHVVKFFEEGKSPVPVSTTIEIVAFMEAALRSRHVGGEWVALAGPRSR
jgi:predicted dehydrogenase